MEAKVIAKIIKMGFNSTDAVKMVSMYWEMAANRGAETVKEYATEITGFYCF